MLGVLCNSKNSLRLVLLVITISFFYGGFLGVSSTGNINNAYAATLNNLSSGVSCPSPAAPTSQSLLVVVLDRSGSLVQTDPEQYSTSVTKILADLWPGSMAVILMSGGGDALQHLGPTALTSNDARNALKNQIEQYRNQLGAFTPLQAALQEAFNLLSQSGFPKGSRVILITDGEPSILGDLNGTRQKQAIENGIIPQFCDQGMPINAFGLSINNTTDPLANPLLEEITEKTRGTAFEPYQNITDPSSLGKAVITLYAKWRGLTLAPVQIENRIFSVSIDTYARQAYIVTFHSSNKVLPLLGPDHQVVPEAAFQQYSTDTHYDFYNLSGKDFSTSGRYTVDASSDLKADVYKLEETRLQVTMIEPTSQTTASAGQPLTVTAAFYDRNTNNHVHLNPGQGSIEVTCTLLVNGTSTFCGEEPLNQQPKPNDDLYSNQITPPQVGTVVIKVIGTVEDVPIAETPVIRLQVQQAPCGLNFGCYWQNYRLPIILGATALVLIVLVLIWLLKAGSYGWLRCQRPHNHTIGEISLGEGRSIWKKLFRKSTVSSSEIEGHPNAGTCFNFRANTSFVLVFKRRGKVYLKPTARNTATFIIKPGTSTPGQQAITLNGNKRGGLLSPGSIVNIDREDRFSFQLSQRPRRASGR